MNYAQSNVFLLVSSVYQPESFKSITNQWVSELRQFAPGVPCISFNINNLHLIIIAIIIFDFNDIFLLGCIWILVQNPRLDNWFLWKR